METFNPGTVTRLLIDYSNGDKEALAELIPLIYDELRKIARRQLAREYRASTLDTVALIHEAYIKLEKQENLKPHNRGHFFAISARTMRSILVDIARGKKRKKRGEGVDNLPLHELEEHIFLSDDEVDYLLDLDVALIKLEKENKEAADMVVMRYMGGLTIDEIGATLNMPSITVRRRWSFAKSWLRRELGEAME